MPVINRFSQPTTTRCNYISLSANIIEAIAKREEAVKLSHIDSKEDELLENIFFDPVLETFPLIQTNMNVCFQRRNLQEYYDNIFNKH